MRRPYLAERYSTVGVYLWQISGDLLLTRIRNALVNELNDRSHYFHLPKCLIIILDRNVIENSKVFDYGASQIFADILKWLLININLVIEERKENLLKQWLGAMASYKEPCLIWVTMIPRPECDKKHVYSLTRKLNSVLEDVISGDKRPHILKCTLIITITYLIGQVTSHETDSSHFGTELTMQCLSMNMGTQNSHLRVPDHRNPHTNLLPIRIQLQVISTLLTAIPCHTTDTSGQKNKALNTYLSISGICNQFGPCLFNLLFPSSWYV